MYFRHETHTTVNMHVACVIIWHCCLDSKFHTTLHSVLLIHQLFNIFANLLELVECNLIWLWHFSALPLYKIWTEEGKLFFLTDKKTSRSAMQWKQTMHWHKTNTTLDLGNMKGSNALVKKSRNLSAQLPKESMESKKSGHDSVRHV